MSLDIVHPRRGGSKYKRWSATGFADAVHLPPTQLEVTRFCHAVPPGTDGFTASDHGLCETEALKLNWPIGRSLQYGEKSVERRSCLAHRIVELPHEEHRSLGSTFRIDLNQPTDCWASDILFTAASLVGLADLECLVAIMGIGLGWSDVAAFYDGGLQLPRRRRQDPTKLIPRFKGSNVLAK